MATSMNLEKFATWMHVGRSKLKISVDRRFAYRGSHLDEIDEDWSGGWSLDEAASLFKQCVVTIEDGWMGRVSLACPLSMGDCLVSAAPGVAELVPRAEEPPSFYLFDSRYFLAVPDGRETFSSAYLDDPFCLEMDNTATVFECYRDEESRRMEWEFSSVLWFHIYPHAGVMSG